MLFSKLVALLAINETYAQYGSGFKGDILETKIEKVRFNVFFLQIALWLFFGHYGYFWPIG